MKQLKDFQRKAKNKLYNNSKDILKEKDKDNLLIFQSPTGSGKTFTMAKYIEDMVKWGDKKGLDICFLWLSIGRGNLEEQSYKSLHENLQEKTQVLRLKDVIHADSLDKGDVVVFNWQKIRSKDKETGKWTNIAMKDNERGNFVDCIKETKRDNKRIILIIDESHYDAKTDRAKELRQEIINADLTIEVSATPILSDYKIRVKVKRDDVVAEEMIKKEIIINEKISEGDSITALLRSAYKKREELKNYYEQEQVKINPLCLIQIPDVKRGKELKRQIESFLREKTITTDNGKLAIHLNEEKINNERELLARNEDEAEYLIFKKAIDTGWDCPRAQILIKFREAKKLKFEIQTLGRILRMPEQKYYKEEQLNKAFVYTNDKQYEIVNEEYNPNIIKQFGGKRKGLYQPIDLLSSYKNRVDFGDIEDDLYGFGDEGSIFFKEFSKYVGKNEQEINDKLDLDVDNVEEQIILNDIIKSKIIDQFNKESEIKRNQFKNVRLADIYLKDFFDYIIKNNLHGYAPIRSITTVKSAIRVFFKHKLGINMAGDGLTIVRNIVLKNHEKISYALDKTIEAYKTFKEEKNKKEEENAWEEYIWNIENDYYVNPNTHEEKNYNKFIYDTCFIKCDSALEKEFIEEVLETRENILWWWKNGSGHLKSNFGIKYEKENGHSNFQPDFIVCFVDNTIGIYDTKTKDRDVEDTKLKAEALQRYIEKRDKLKGGIIINENNNWKINKHKEYKPNESSQWESF